MFSRDVIHIEALNVAERIEKAIRDQVLGTLKRRASRYLRQALLLARAGQDA